LAGRLLEIIVILLAVRVIWRTLGSVVTMSGGARTSPGAGPSRDPRPVKLVRDPVCGTYVSPDSAIAQGGHYFCSEKCRDDYRRQAS
jgi:YHS domain-containing protein